MKSRFLTLLTAITLFAASAMAVHLAAQDKQDQRQQHHHYKLIDMGTFGGPSSAFGETAPFSSASGDVTSRGLAVGSSSTSVSTTPTSNCGFSIPFIFRAFRWEDGAVTDLGALPGGSNCSSAVASSASGEIIGTSENGELDPLIGINQVHAVLWKDNHILDLGTLGGFESVADGITNGGQVVGSATNAVPDPFACFGLGTQCRAFLWRDGVMHDLGTLGGPDALGFLINEHGQISGVANTNSTPDPNCALPLTTHPFLWENGKMKDLGTLGGTCGLAVALNNKGQVAGNSNLVGDSISHPFLWPGENGKMRDLGTLGGSFGTANAINERGDVVGYSSVTGDESELAFLWRGGVLTNLGSLDGDPCSTANAINSKGQVVGISTATCDYSTGRRAFLWEHASMVDLNALILPDSGMQLTLAEAINDRGEIAVNGTPMGCDVVEQCGHAVLLIPCDGNHPSIEGCDYSMVDASAATFIPPGPRPASGDKPLLVRSQRNNRFRFPGFASGPRN